MDIHTYTETIKTGRFINPVRGAVANCIDALTKGYIAIPETDNIRSKVYAPDIRKAILKSLVDILNYRGISSQTIKMRLTDLATLEYGRDLRKPIIDILEAVASEIGDDEVVLGSTWDYPMFNCRFDLVDGTVTEVGSGEGVGGTDKIPNAFDPDGYFTVKSESTIGEDLEYCMMLYDANGDYLPTETLRSGASQWKPVNSRFKWTFQETVGCFRLFIRDFRAGLDLDTIVSGLNDEDTNAIIQVFYDSEVVNDAD